MSKSPHCGNFPCPNCELLFTFKSNLKRHITRKHPMQSQKQERYQCAICYKKYSSKCYLKDHIRIVHRHDRTLLAECKICYKKFSSRNAVRDHQRYMHNITQTTMYTCDHCNKQFNKKHNMQVHIMYSPCNPFRIIRKKIRCLHCGVECLENRSRAHIRACAVRKVMKLPVKPQRRRPTKENVYSSNENSVRKTETGLKNDMVLSDNIEDLNVSVKIEDIDENSMEDDSSATSNANNNTLRRSNRRRKRINYQVLDGDGFTVTVNELTQLCEPLGVQKLFRVNDYTIKLEATESELANLDMADPDIDIMNWDSDTQTQHNCLSSNSEDTSSVFRSNILINSNISYSNCEDFSNYDEVSVDGVSENNTREKNTICPTNVKTTVTNQNTEKINVMNHASSLNNVGTLEIHQEIKNEEDAPRKEFNVDSNQNDSIKKEAFISSALKQEIETDLATEITKEEEELMKLVQTDFVLSEISHEEDANTQTIKDIRFYKYLGII